MRSLFYAVLLTAGLAGIPAIAHSAELSVGANDTVQTVFAAQKGARVTVRLRSGQEFNGIVREVNARVVQLGTLGGKEYFDAVVSLDAVEAVFFRTRE